MIARALQRVGSALKLKEAGTQMPEWIGTLLFFAAVVLTAAKLNRDFAERGILGYGLLVVLIAAYAGAVGMAYT